MKRRLWLIFAAVMIATVAQAGGNHSGIINFDVGRSPGDNDLPQPVTLFGCNNTIFRALVNWEMPNQVFGDVTYGASVSKSGKKYFVAKYYIASPPAYLGSKYQGEVYLGLVTPDRFVFQGRRPAQIVNMDYQILKPISLKEVNVDFNYSGQGEPSCLSRNVTSIPINTACKDLPWKAGAEGASGIGHLKLLNDSAQVFLPILNADTEQPAQCDVTLLDDVMLDHEVYFVSDGNKTNSRSKTVSLTKHYLERRDLKLICMPRKPSDIPAGCGPVPEN